MKLHASHTDEYRQAGVLVVESLLDDDDLAPVIDEILAFVDHRANTHQAPLSPGIRCS